MKIGIELEYWVVNQKGKLVSSQKLAEKTDSAEQEFVEPLIEVKTSPSSSIEELNHEVKRKLKKLLYAADSLDQKIVPLGTPLNSGKIEMLESERGRIQSKIIGENLEAAKRVAGTHIHFEKKQVKKQINTLTALDPALALTNSSPYYQGEKTSHSSRNQVYRYHCYQDFPQHGQLWRYTDSVQEWEERIEKNFQIFKYKGKTCNISKNKLKKYFSPYNALWTPIRLRKKFPTIEWRAPDSGRIRDTLRMASEIKSIVEKEVDKPKFEEIQNLSRKAINQGLESPEIKTYLSKCGFSVDKYNPISLEIEKNQSISIEQARKIRLKYAKELNREIDKI